MASFSPGVVGQPTPSFTLIYFHCITDVNLVSITAVPSFFCVFFFGGFTTSRLGRLISSDRFRCFFFSFLFYTFFGIFFFLALLCCSFCRVSSANSVIEGRPIIDEVRGAKAASVRKVRFKNKKKIFFGFFFRLFCRCRSPFGSLPETKAARKKKSKQREKIRRRRRRRRNVSIYKKNK